MLAGGLVFLRNLKQLCIISIMVLVETDRDRSIVIRKLAQVLPINEIYLH